MESAKSIPRYFFMTRRALGAMPLKTPIAASESVSGVPCGFKPEVMLLSSKEPMRPLKKILFQVKPPYAAPRTEFTRHSLRTRKRAS